MAALTARIALFLGLMIWLVGAQAINQIQLRIGNWHFDDLAAENSAMAFSLTTNGLQLDASADKLALPDKLGALHQLRLHCDDIRLQSGQWQCESGQVAFEHQRLGRQTLHFTLSAQPDNDRYRLRVSGFKLAEAQVTINADYQKNDWSVTVNADQLNLESISDWLPLLMGEEQLAALAGWSYQGQLSLNAEVNGQQAQLHNIDVSWHASGLGFSNQAGTQAAEELSLDGKLSARQQQGHWQWQAALISDKGQAYVDPVFVDLTQHPIKLDASGSLSEDFTAGSIDQFHAEQNAVIATEGSMKWADNTLQSLSLKTDPSPLGAVYTTWLQPFTVGTAAAKLTGSGQLAAQLDWQQGQYQLQMDFDAVSVTDEKSRFSMQNLNGKLGWTNSDTSLKTALNWSSAKLYAVDLGAAAIAADSINSGLTLTDFLALPVLDGQLQVNAFALQQKPDGHVDWHFDGLLTPISMESLSAALAWPELHGKLSGVIPRVSYSNQQLTIDGALQVKVFDGTTVIRDLRLSSPLGSLPQLYANIDISSLDLELLTSTFDFGRITGNIEGYVHNLRLSNWKPVQFDASLKTPAENPGKRRISQKAVDNLTQIGGGATGMLSRSFLRFFEDFSYQKLGLACRLQNDVCQMSGIGEAEQGYYIVKGGGGLPPWINVVGYTRRVDWADLIARLMAVRDSSGPVIE